jgi:Xaa-Pro aminopeptidase
MSGRDIPEEIGKTYEALRRNGLDFALLSSLPNVTYVSGWDVPPVIGAAADLTGWLPNGLVVLSARDETGWLIVSDLLAGAAKSSNRLDHIEIFPGFGHFEKVEVDATWSHALSEVLRAAGLANDSRAVGVEPRSLPLAAQQVIQREFPNIELRDASPSLEEARRIKTGREIELIRQAVAVADVAQNALIEQASRSGQSDLEVWDALTGAMERKTGGVVATVAELVTGPRTSQVAPGGPIGRRIEAGDTGLLDISPRVKGYWADCTNTVVFEHEPSAEQRRYFDAAREACELGIATIRPGARACDVEATIRKTFERHGFPVAHYSGHQLGTGLNETPRLVPYDTTTIESGMVFAVEPGAYAGERGTTGARAEKVVLVTESGPEILSSFEWGI